MIHDFLRTSYWAAGVPRETMRRSNAHSLAHGLYRGRGWTSLPHPETFMQPHFPGIYTAPEPDAGP